MGFNSAFKGLKGYVVLFDISLD